MSTLAANTALKPLAKSLLHRFATALTAISFLGVGVTGLAMSLGIGGRSLNGLHVGVGIAFVAASVLHVVKNGRAIVKLMARRSVQLLFGAGAIAFVLIVALSPTPAGRPRRGEAPRAASSAVEAPTPAAH